MGLRYSAVLILVGFAVPAAAQNSTTNCQADYFGNITCRTKQDPGVDWRLGQRPSDTYSQREADRARVRQQIQQLPPPSYRPTPEQARARICAEELDKAKGNEEQLASIRRICAP